MNDIPIVGGSWDDDWVHLDPNGAVPLAISDGKDLYKFKIDHTRNLDCGGVRFYLHDNMDYIEACELLEKRGINS